MRYPRQNKIIELISTYNIETQEELAKLLHKNGFNVTQATVSRDIKELKLVKLLGPEGRYKYATNSPSEAPPAGKYLNLLRDTLVSVTSSGNIVIVKTLSGCANAACEALDALHLETVLGTIAGDNTIFIVVGNESNTPHVVKLLNELIQQQ